MELVSVRVLGSDLRGKGPAFVAGLEWAIEHGCRVANLSLSSKSDAMFGVFHELADTAYFRNVLLVCAANNVPGPSYPSLFSSVVSVAAHDEPDPWRLYYNPSPPVEFGAWGVDVPIAWRDGGNDRRHRQQLRLAARRRDGRPALLEAPGPDPVRGQGRPRGDRRQPIRRSDARIVRRRARRPPTSTVRPGPARLGGP